MCFRTFVLLDELQQNRLLLVTDQWAIESVNVQVYNISVFGLELCWLQDGWRDRAVCWSVNVDCGWVKIINDCNGNGLHENINYCVLCLFSAKWYQCDLTGNVYFWVLRESIVSCRVKVWFRLNELHVGLLFDYCLICAVMGMTTKSFYCCWLGLHLLVI